MSRCDCYHCRKLCAACQNSKQPNKKKPKKEPKQISKDSLPPNEESQSKKDKPKICDTDRPGVPINSISTEKVTIGRQCDDKILSIACSTATKHRIILKRILGIAERENDYLLQNVPLYLRTSILNSLEHKSGSGSSDKNVSTNKCNVECVFNSQSTSFRNGDVSQNCSSDCKYANNVESGYNPAPNCNINCTFNKQSKCCFVDSPSDKCSKECGKNQGNFDLEPNNAPTEPSTPNKHEKCCSVDDSMHRCNPECEKYKNNLEASINQGSLEWYPFNKALKCCCVNDSTHICNPNCIKFKINPESNFDREPNNAPTEPSTPNKHEKCFCVDDSMHRCNPECEKYNLEASINQGNFDREPNNAPTEPSTPNKHEKCCCVDDSMHRCNPECEKYKNNLEASINQGSLECCPFNKPLKCCCVIDSTHICNPNCIKFKSNPESNFDREPSTPNKHEKCCSVDDSMDRCNPECEKYKYNLEASINQDSLDCCPLNKPLKCCCVNDSTHICSPNCIKFVQSIIDKEPRYIPTNPASTYKCSPECGKFKSNPESRFNPETNNVSNKKCSPECRFSKQSNCFCPEDHECNPECTKYQSIEIEQEVFRICRQCSERNKQAIENVKREHNLKEVGSVEHYSEENFIDHCNCTTVINEKKIAPKDNLSDISDSEADFLINSYVPKKTIDFTLSECQMKKTHGEEFGDDKYHFLMVDTVTSTNIDFPKMVDHATFVTDQEERVSAAKTVFDETALEANIKLNSRYPMLNNEKIKPMKTIPEEELKRPIQEAGLPYIGKEPDQKRMSIVSWSESWRGVGLDNKTAIETIEETLAELANQNNQRANIRTSTAFEEIVKEEEKKAAVSNQHDIFGYQKTSDKKVEEVDEPPPKKWYNYFTKKKNRKSNQSQKIGLLDDIDENENNGSDITLTKIQAQMQEENEERRNSLETYHRRSSPIEDPVCEKEVRINQYLNNLTFK